MQISDATLDRAYNRAVEGITHIDDDAGKLDAMCPGWDDWGKATLNRASLASWLWTQLQGSQQAPPQQQQSQMAQMAQQKRQMLRSFRKNTRKRYALWNQNITGMGYGGTYSAVAPQVGLATRIWAQFRFDVRDAGATTSTLLPRGPFGFVKRIQLVTNLGSNNIWDTDGWNAHCNNLTKGDSGNRADVNLDQEYTDLYPSNGATTRYYPNDPLFQYPQLAATANTYQVAFTLRIDLVPNVKKNFTQGMLNLQAPQVQASINVTTGQAADMYGSPTTQTLTGACNFYYEYFEIPNPLRRVALPSGMLHCTLQQTQAIAAAGLQQYTIPRQGILLRLQQETVLNSLLAKGGPVGTDNNAGTAGIDFFNLQLNNQDTIYTKNWELQKQLQQEEFDLFFSFAGMNIFDFFDAMDEPGSGDLRDAIDTEAVTTTIFGTSINSAATIGTAFMNLTREILLPFNTQATGVANAA